jgi:hypothetical protein
VVRHAGAEGKRGHAATQSGPRGQAINLHGRSPSDLAQWLFRSGREHAPMRIADPFIMIIHVIGSLRVIHDFGPTAGLLFQGVANTLRVS